MVAGASSSAQLAALAALTPNDPQYQPGFEDADTSVSAVVALYGDYDWLDTAGRVVRRGQDAGRMAAGRHAT